MFSELIFYHSIFDKQILQKISIINNLQDLKYKFPKFTQSIEVILCFFLNFLCSEEKFTNWFTVILFYNLIVKNTLPFLYLQLKTHFGPNLGLRLQIWDQPYMVDSDSPQASRTVWRGLTTQTKIGKVIFFEAKYFRWDSEPENPFR